MRITPARTVLSHVAEKILGEFREFEPVAVDRVGQQHRLPAGAPQDGKPRSLDDGKREDLEALHHLGEVLHAVDPRLPEGRRDDVVVPGQRRRVKARGVAACGVGVGFQDDERLLGRRRQLHEPDAIGHVLQVEPDDPGVGVRRQELEEVILVDIELVSHADELAGPQVLVGEQPHAVQGDPTALGHDRDVPLSHLPVLQGDKGKNEAVFQVDDADAVGPHDPHVPAPCYFQHFLLEVAAPIGIFAEAARFDDGPPDPLVPAGIQGLRHMPRGQEEHGQVGHPGHVLDGRVDPDPVDVAAVLAHRMDSTLEPEALQVQDNVPPQVGGRCRDSENNNTCRKKDLLHPSLLREQ